MGRVWLVFAGAVLCQACGGQSSEDGPGIPRGGASGGSVTLGSGGASTGGTNASGGQSEGSGAGCGDSIGLPRPCEAQTFPAPSPDGSPADASALCLGQALYCRFDDHSCGRSAAPGGFCFPRTPCSDADDDGPLCGCDGVVYRSSRAARAAGVDIDTNGECQLQGSFFCGGRACKLDTEACVAHLNHIDGTVTPSCVPLAQECLAALVSREDQFCECVSPGRCTCQVQSLDGGIGIIKLCGDR